MDLVQPKRSVGEVTGATTGATAVTMIVFYLIREVFGVDVPADVQGSFTILIVLVAGWLVKPKPVIDAGTIDVEVHPKPVAPATVKDFEGNVAQVKRRDLRE